MTRNGGEERGDVYRLPCDHVGWRGLAVVIACVLAGPTSAQNTQFVDVAPLGHLPTATDSSFGIALGDVDGDGDLDAMLATQVGPRLYVNDGRGRFADVSQVALPLHTEPCRSVALGDLDGDGDLDAAIGTEGPTDLLFVGDGSGGFSDAPSQLPAKSSSTVTQCFCDVDGDGDHDLVRGILIAGLELFLNDGSGGLTGAPSQLPSPQPLSIPTDLSFGDVDGDGDADLAWAGGLFGQQTFVYENDGRGGFTDVSATAIPRQASIDGRAVHLGDLDGDGDLDLLTVGSPSSALHLNNGSGVFTSASVPSLPQTTSLPTSLAAGDFDEDGDLDFIVGVLEFLSPAPNALWLNDGTASFVDASAARMSVTDRPTLALAAGDVDGDADLDVLVGNGAGLFGFVDDLYLNRHRHLETIAPPAVGGALGLRFVAAPGYGQVIHIALPGLAFRLAPAPVPVPFGSLFLRPAGVLPLPWAAVSSVTHEVIVHVAVPSNPALAGSTVYTQALFVEPFGVEAPALTGYTADVIR